jgi:hypothetical protein
MGHDPKTNPYYGHCAQATAVAWVLSKTIYRKGQFYYKPFHSLDGEHYWLSREPKGQFRKSDRLDLTEHPTDGKFDFSKRRGASWVTRKKCREDLAKMVKKYPDILLLYDETKQKLFADE